jgi:DNA-binding NtrC family response regulator
MSEERHAVLVIDRDAPTIRAVTAAAEGAGLGVEVAEGLTGGMRALGEGRWVATFLSLDLVGADLDLAERVAREPSSGALVLVTGRPTLEMAMQAARLGLMELVGRPPEAAVLERVLRVAGEAGSRVELPAVKGSGEGGLVGGSPALLEVFQGVGRVAGSGATVLITGESGTGKELVARSLHRLSPRSGRAFVAVNCAAIPEDLLESELFGHERGAFTGAISRKEGRFERADGGTLFLDEIGDMSLVLQAKILRVLQEREIERLGGEDRIPVDVRIVAATHRDLGELIAAGEFREDLYYRLAVVRLHLPPLRERPGDVRDLTLHYAARFATAHARPLHFIAEAALRRLEGHPWPGNVRELRNVVERAVLTARGDTLRGEHIELDPPSRTPSSAVDASGYPPSLSLAEVEALHIGRVLREVDGQVGRAAEILGVHRNTVARKMREYGVAG